MVQSIYQLDALLRKVQQMKTIILWSILLVSGQLIGTSYAQSRDEIARQLAGMWRLVGNPQRLADGTTREGSNSVGYAFFDANAGHMCFLSMNPDRPRWKSGTPAPEEAVAAIRGFGAYCATLEIHAKEGFMVRHYDINQNPNAVGGATTRWFTFQGADRMSLRVDASELNRPVVESTFVWERVK
jgi:hypothetical protein